MKTKVQNIKNLLKLAGLFVLAAGITFLVGYSLSRAYNLWTNLFVSFMELAFVKFVIDAITWFTKWYVAGIAIGMGLLAVEIVKPFVYTALVIQARRSVVNYQRANFGEALRGFGEKGAKVYRQEDQNEG